MMKTRIAGTRLLLSTVLLAALGVSGTVSESVLANPLPAGEDQVVNGCTIVANPTPKNHTECPGADLSGTELSGADLSYADLSTANLSGATLTGAAPVRRDPDGRQTNRRQSVLRQPVLRQPGRHRSDRRQALSHHNARRNSQQPRLRKLGQGAQSGTT